jgi:hypothetical protein
MDDPAEPRADTATLRAAVLTVVTVCRNPGPLLAEVIDSVAALGRSGVAHVVIDGASTDGTVEYLLSGQRHLAYWQSEPDTGIYDAMNKGWAVVNPDSYVLFLGADDRLLSLPTPQELSDAKDSGAALIYGDATIGEAPFRSRFTAELLTANTLHHQTLLIRKAAHPAPPFNTKYRVFGDWDFNVRLWKRGEKAVYLPSLRSYAGTGGISARRPLGEVFEIVRSHAGWVTASTVSLRVMKRKLQALVAGRMRPRRG